jgi:hypothetical protein
MPKATAVVDSATAAKAPSRRVVPVRSQAVRSGRDTRRPVSATRTKPSRVSVLSAW